MIDVPSNHTREQIADKLSLSNNQSSLCKNISGCLQVVSYHNHIVGAPVPILTF